MYKYTVKQKKLLKEINELKDLILINPDEAEFEQDSIMINTFKLEQIKDRLIRSEVLSLYLLMDSWLDLYINFFFFKIKQQNSNKFKIFKSLLEKLFLLQKLDIIKQIIKIPSNIEKTILKTNDLRNSLAHSMDAVNRYKNKPIYNKGSIYLIKVFKSFQADVEKVHDFFMENMAMFNK